MNFLFLAKYITIYRPSYVQSIHKNSDGSWTPNYGLGWLRAKLFGVRVPILWALDLVCTADNRTLK